MCVLSTLEVHSQAQMPQREPQEPTPKLCFSNWHFFRHTPAHIMEGAETQSTYHLHISSDSYKYTHRGTFTHMLALTYIGP